MSASHVIQAGTDRFIGKDEAYITNRKKMEKSVLRKEGNAYVLDLIVEVPAVPVRQSNTNPLKLTQSIKLQTGENEGNR